MSYIIVGLRQSGNLVLYDQRAASRPTLEEAEHICHTFDYKQLMVVEGDGSRSYYQRYEYSRKPSIRAVSP